MNGYQRTIALLVAPLLLSAPAARAADQLVPGTKLLLKSANGRETLNEATQGTLDVVLTSGTIRYCAAFGPGSVKRDQPGRFIAHKAPAPGSCPGPPPTTSTTSTTSTSTTSTSVPGPTTTTSTSTS